QHTNVEPQHAVIHSSQTFANTKNLDLNHSFVSNKVIGPDRFRFITSYWTTSDTSRAIDAGTSTNETRLGLLGPIAGSWPAIMANPKVEVDAGEGFSTLAVVLQYEGVVHLAGITAALKLPSGFKAQLPLIDDLNNYNIALSSYRGHIYPSQGIVLYFSLDVTTNARVQSPGLGILALHFLRSDQRSVLDSLDASQQDIFARALSTTTNTTVPNWMFNDNFDFNRNYYNQFGRFIPFDFINQVTPIIFKITGREILDVSLAGGIAASQATGGGLNSQSSAVNGIIPLSNTTRPIGISPGITGTNNITSIGNSTNNVTTPNSRSDNSGLPSDQVITPFRGGGTAISKGPVYAPITRLISYPVYVFFSNRGDVRIHDLVAIFSTNVSSLVGAAVSETTYPLGIVGQSTFHIFTLEPYSTQAVTLYIRSSVTCSALAPLTVRSSYTNVIGLTQTQTNTVTLGVGSGFCPQYRSIPGGGTVLG
ncbi:MAG TPA: hypothetical protein VEH06_08355, partial [Candidatus Bathyarchaeia archaeon]|nr:hypothetical protein [Candidatus Bathyarchaeia archaeon]